MSFESSISGKKSNEFIHQCKETKCFSQSANLIEKTMKKVFFAKKSKGSRNGYLKSRCDPENSKFIRKSDANLKNPKSDLNSSEISNAVNIEFITSLLQLILLKSGDVAVPPETEKKFPNGDDNNSEKRGVKRNYLHIRNKFYKKVNNCHFKNWTKKKMYKFFRAELNDYGLLRQEIPLRTTEKNIKPKFKFNSKSRTKSDDDFTFRQTFNTKTKFEKRKGKDYKPSIFRELVSDHNENAYKGGMKSFQSRKPDNQECHVAENANLAGDFKNEKTAQNEVSFYVDTSCKIAGSKISNEFRTVQIQQNNSSNAHVLPYKLKEIRSSKISKGQVRGNQTNDLNQLHYRKNHEALMAQALESFRHRINLSDGFWSQLNECFNPALTNPNSEIWNGYESCATSCSQIEKFKLDIPQIEKTLDDMDLRTYSDIQNMHVTAGEEAHALDDLWTRIYASKIGLKDVIDMIGANLKIDKFLKAQALEARHKTIYDEMMCRVEIRRKLQNIKDKYGL